MMKMNELLLPQAVKGASFYLYQYLFPRPCVSGYLLTASHLEAGLSFLNS